MCAFCPFAVSVWVYPFVLSSFLPDDSADAQRIGLSSCMDRYLIQTTNDMVADFEREQRTVLQINRKGIQVRGAIGNNAI